MQNATSFGAGAARAMSSGCLAVVLAAGFAAENSTNSASPEPRAGASQNDHLTFANGDRLRGAFVSFDSATGVRWQHPAIEPVMSVKPAEIGQIGLERSRAGEDLEYNCVVQLVNGDELTGRLTSADRERLSLATWYGGTLSVPRATVRSLMLRFDKNEILYEGPTGMEGWTATSLATAQGAMIRFAAAGVLQAVQVEDAADVAAPKEEGKKEVTWEYQDKALVASAGGLLGRDFKLPPESVVEFDMDWEGYPALTVYLYADALDKASGLNAFALNFSSRRAYLNRFTGTSSKSVGSATVTELGNTGTQARFAIRTSLDQQAMALYINDTLAYQWSNIGQPPGEGTGLMFYYRGNTPVRLSNIRVAKSFGLLEGTGAAANASERKEDLVILNNRDKISGQVESIQDGVINFLLQSSPIKIPLERARWIHLATDDSAAAKSAGQEVKLQFYHRGLLTVQLERWDQDLVVAKSPCLGDVKLKPSAFKAIQFKPAAPKPVSATATSSTERLQLLERLVPALRKF